jgi:hypothetical protein
MDGAARADEEGRWRLGSFRRSRADLSLFAA